LTSDALPGNPDGTLCEAAKMEGGGGATTAAAAGVGDDDGVVEGLAKGDPKIDVGFPWSPMFDTTGADVEGPKGEKDVFAFTESRRVDGTSVEPEALGTEELEIEF
jgi:hypothetical protein